MRPIINSKKHYNQVTLTTVGTGATSNQLFIDSVETPTTPSHVQEGAIVKAIFVEIWAIGSVADQFFTAVLVKLPSGLGTPTTANMALLNDWEGKKNIMYTTQGLASNDGIAAPIPLVRQYFKIPKSKQRFGLGDRLVWALMSRGSADIKLCGFATYKEYT